MTTGGTVIATVAAGVAHGRRGQRQRGVDLDRQHGHLRRRRPDGDDRPGRRPGRSDEHVSRSTSRSCSASRSPASPTGDVTLERHGRRRRRRHGHAARPRPTTWRSRGMTTYGHGDRDDRRGRGDRRGRQHQHGVDHRPTTRSPTTSTAPTVTINQAVGQADPDQHQPDQLHGRVQRAGHRLRDRRRDVRRAPRAGPRPATVTGGPARPTTSRSPA